MSGLLYESTFENVSVGEALNFFELTLGSAAIVIHFMKLTTGDIDADQSRMVLAQLATASSGGTDLAEIPLQRRNTRIAATTVELATSGGTVGDVYLERWWNRQTAFIYHPTPETRILLDSTAGPFIVRAVAGLATPTSGIIIWEEF